MPRARQFPPGFDWIPVKDGIQECVAPYRFVGADKLASYNLGTGWTKIHRDVNRTAFHEAWTMWLCRRLKEARVSAAASRELEKLKPEKTKPRTARTAGASGNRSANASRKYAQKPRITR